MNISRLFIERPVATSLVMIAVLLAGIVAYRLLPLSALPEVDYPTIQVVTIYPGASPEVMATTVTAPLERQFGQMPGLKQMTSSSSGGASVLTLQFNLDLGLDVAEQQVQAAINAAATLLPNDLPAPPIYNKVNPADAPILTLALTSKSLALPQIEDLADTRLVQKIGQVSGVGLVSIGGGLRPAVRIEANMPALTGYGLSLDDVRTAIGANNVNMAKGGFDGPERAYTIDANDQLRSADDYAQLIVAYRNGSPVRLKDVARVTEGAENSRLAAWAGRVPAVVVNVQKQPGANVIDVVDSIKTLMPQLRQSLPAAVELVIVADRTVPIRAAIRDVQIELVLAVLLVVVTIFLFLGKPTATLIPSLAVPLSLVGTFGFMYLAGFSLNNLTLMALTIATGFVVDDAIVMIENIARHVERGLKPYDAALVGAAEIGFTIVSLTVSLIAVLIPLLFMSDVIGRLFREFAITLAASIVVSLLVSLTLTPMMAARLLTPHQPKGEAGRWATLTNFFPRVIAGYDRTLSWVLNRQGLTLVVALVTFGLSVMLYIVAPKGFFPIQDNGIIQGATLARQSVSFTAMGERQQALVDALLEDPAVETITSTIGIDGINLTLNSGRLQIVLKPIGKRDASPAVIKRLMDRAAKVTGIELSLMPIQDLTVDDKLDSRAYRFTLQHPDPEVLKTIVPAFVDTLRHLPELADVTSDLQTDGLAAYVNIDRPTAARFGITPVTVANALYNAFGQRIVSTIFTQASQYRVILEATTGRPSGPEALAGLFIPGANGAQVPLGSIARIEERPTALTINRLGQVPMATISFNVGHGFALGDAVAAIQTSFDASTIMQGARLRLQGAARAFEGALSNEVWLILAAIVVMYIVLGVLYESFIHPVTILSTLPSAAIGAFLALQFTGRDLDVVALIGIILLIGIVKKNAIMIVDFALDAERHDGLAPRDAIHRACLLRLRPILMTTFAAMFGAIPLAFGGGIGAELRQPLGITIIGGMIVSQVLTLYTTPVIYLAFDRAQRWLDRSAGRETEVRP